jgi:hypothetical protein
MASMANAENVRSVRSETFGRRPVISAAVFRLHCQHAANQTRPTDRDHEYHHAVDHRFSGSKRQIIPACAPQKPPAPATFCRGMWQRRSLIIQAKYGTFLGTECLSAVLLS